MVQVQDVRRLSVTALLFAILLVLWLFILWLYDAALWEWSVPERATKSVTFLGWMWIGAGILLVLLLVVVFPLFSVRQAQGGPIVKGTRQVQCQECYAVFQVRDDGQRPLTHVCPNCRALGIYTGKAPPVGRPPEPAPTQRPVNLVVRCQNCDHRFDVADNGVRPLRVTCPDCGAIGSIETRASPGSFQGGVPQV